MSLADHILNRYEKGVFDQPAQDFLPKRYLAELITSKSVGTEFQEVEIEDTKYDHKEKNDQLLLDFIIKHARKVFATAVVCDISGNALYRTMATFKKSDLKDSSLPLSEETISTMSCFSTRTWSNLKKRYFREKQFIFLAPVFSTSIFKLDLEPEHIFPFIWISNEAKEGTFSQVYQVKIHDSHHDIIVDGQKPNVAIKEIKERHSSTEQDIINEEWAAEAKALEELSGLNHENIIQRIAAITRGSKRYFMFQWADGGTLRDFWEGLPRPPLTSSFVKEIVTQFRGLADALHELHVYKGGSYRHGDLKPENILIFKNSTQVGIFKVADMGLAKHHTVATHLRPATSTRYGTVRYEPPEVVTHKHSDEGRSRLYDVWSIGCIGLELIVWLLYGYAELTRFNESLKRSMGDSSPYFEIDDNSGAASVHSRVEACMDHILMDIECTGKTAIRELLDLVRTKLLVVSLPERRPSLLKNLMGDNGSSSVVVSGTDRTQSPNRPPGPSRATARNFRDQLDNIIGNGNEYESYWCTGKPREGAKGPVSYRLPMRIKEGFLSPNAAYHKNPIDRGNSKPAVGLQVQHGVSVRPNMVRINRQLSQSQLITYSQSHWEILIRYRMWGFLKLGTCEYWPHKQAPILSFCVEKLIYAYNAASEWFYSVKHECMLTILKPLNKLWDFPVDNRFAASLFKDQTTLEPLIRTPRGAQLCGKCMKMDFWEPLFQIQDKPSELEKQSKDCKFCMMRWNICKDVDRNDFPTINFARKGSTLTMNERYPPALSICRRPDVKVEIPMLMPIQIGIPELPEVGNEQHLRTLRQWLKDCDENHPKCRLPAAGTLPTRLLDLGESSAQLIKLHQTQKGESMKYSALSHPWGPRTKENPHFCTIPENFEQHMEEIKFDELPATFQNAVTMSRELGFRYLWIDSLCIIQGPNGDFNEEAKRMEDVFSSASCIIAASSAAGQSDGFLKPRGEREYVTFVREGLPPIYICQFIDDFAEHVLEGSLNKRGWVLQERALARRTIYFTNKQTYWECGGGVRCETLTKMHNKLASFIGDPNFPEVAIQSSRGGKIRLYQDLYIQYSRLHFTGNWDRPIAIAGLEKRLIHNFNVLGGFGVFDDGRGLLCRSLLWHRGTTVDALERIIFPASAQLKIPTWSWMAYEGGIGYMDLPFNGVDWEESKISSPWTSGSGGDVWHTGDQAGVPGMRAVAHDFDLSGITSAKLKLIYDIPEESSGLKLPVKCVIVGRLKGDGYDERDRLHYVILVTPDLSKATTGTRQIYQRVGVGTLLGRCIKVDMQETMVKIQ